MREYEFTFITKPDLPEAERTKHFEKYEQLLTKDGGEILKKDDWGVKKLAYPIKKHYRGQYVFYDYTGTAENLAEAERLMRIDDNVLRYMSVKLSDKCNVQARKAELAKLAQQSSSYDRRRSD